MNNNEKLGLIERVDHASEDQAKRTLRSMILKCDIRQTTIARAIKDAIERHTPTPVIVYEQPESEDGDEAALDSTHKKTKKKNGQDDGSQDEGAPSATSKKCRSTRRGDVNADPLVGQLIMRKTKTKMKHDKKRSNDHDEEQHNPNSSRPENEQRVSESSIGESSKQNPPTVIDLVTSSDDESEHTEQPEKESLDSISSNEGSLDNDSPSDYSSDSSISDDEGTGSEPQDDGLSGEIPSSLKSSSSGVNRSSEKNSDGSYGVAQSIAFSIATASNQSNEKELSPVISGKKRKAPERVVEKVQNGHSSTSASNAPLNKKPKQNHPQEPQKSRDYWKCQRCSILFPSMAQLLKHITSCNDFTATLRSHHRSEPSSHDHSGQLGRVQKAGQPAGSSFTDEPHNTLQLPSRPRQQLSRDRGLSVPPPSFIREPNSFPRGPTPQALARSRGGIQSSPTGLVQRPVPKLSSDDSTGHQSQLPTPESVVQHFIQKEREKVILQCKLCKKWFTEHGNAVGVCKFHPGAYTSLIHNSQKK